MQKLINWCKRWGVVFSTLFLLAFIPLYPKLPLVDVENTWIYIRIEDFFVLFVLLGWFVSGLGKRHVLKTPLTVPILLFWFIGLVATVQGIVLIFPTIANVFSPVAFLSLLRRIEYMSLFFVSYDAFRQKRFFPFFIAVLTGTVLAVSMYGIGQKYGGFPAFLTMNEEFAKGIAITLSPLSRVSSTFGGHYDLAAYLVLVLPIFVSLLFGYRNWFSRVFLGATILLGLVVMVMTVSRISFAALVVGVGLVVLLQKRKLVLYSLPIVLLGLFLLFSQTSSLSQRFGKTLSAIDVLVDAKTGAPIGHVNTTTSSYFADKVVKQQFSRGINDIGSTATSAASFVIPAENLPSQMVLMTASSVSTGEDLPSGAGYINLTLSPVVKRLDNFLYESNLKSEEGKPQVFFINGQFLVKKAFAYDISFTTRFQGEWPHALTAFKRNILLGSGYGSVSLAVDNSYLRMLAETGSLGFVAFFIIFLIFGVMVKRGVQTIYSPPEKSFVFGLVGGIVGLCINALFIDVFEASKVAFTLWLLVGAATSVVFRYSQTTIPIYPVLKKIATSTYAIIVYIFLMTVVLFSSLLTNYFVGDDFTWFRWAATCGNTINAMSSCAPDVGTIVRYFTQAGGFFYRPGAKLYFQYMYEFFWLNQTMYHGVSVFLHFVVSVLVFFLANKILHNRFLGVLSAFLFLVLSGFSEAVFWVSATGFLYTSVFTILALLSYIEWIDKNNNRYLIASILFCLLSLMFHELGVVTPFLCLLYEFTIGGRSFSLRNIWVSLGRRMLLIPLPLYAVLRIFAQSHWFEGDYSYNLFKFPLNALGNMMGYFFLTYLGLFFLPFYDALRATFRSNYIIIFILLIITCFIVISLRKKLQWHLPVGERSILMFLTLFPVISLVPFLGLGNLAPRYGYLASIGLTILLVYFVRGAYIYLMTYGREIAILSVSLGVGIFGLFHIMQLQLLQTDWHESGDQVMRFFVSMESSYEDYWAKEPMEYNFVHVPIKHGNAWVFPVGMYDALWFLFRNPNVSVTSWSDVSSAMNAVTYDVKTQKIFVFSDDGSVIEKIKPQSNDL